jgi:hypothetical protein|tara:strand:+ start:321 stop:521 length:201 start_codon:yes stop_codon:yes gene_type:complete
LSNSLQATFGNEFFRAEVRHYNDSGLYEVKFFSKDNLVFTEYLGDKNLAVETAQTFVKQRERLHGK